MRCGGPGTGSFLLPAADKEAPSKQIHLLASALSAMPLQGLSRPRGHLRAPKDAAAGKGVSRGGSCDRLLSPAVNHSAGREGMPFPDAPEPAGIELC